MLWFFGFVIGVCYALVMFYFATKLDNYVYDKGITLTKSKLRILVCHIFAWPITMWFKRCWRVE